MPRIARLVVPDYPHHVTQRGNYRQDVFRNDADRKQYLEFMASYSKRYRLDILSYCLMDNHVHFIAVPKDEDSLGRTFGVAHTRYSQYLNQRTASSGHLWQGRFYSCVLDERHLVATVRYIERNPVRAKMVNNPIDHAWSSARSHTDASFRDIINTSPLFEYISITQKEWSEFINNDDDPDDMAQIRNHTMTGRPLGGESFISRLENMFEERLHALPVGRPKRQK
jgi:putative transposase